ncbi:hypothetical protein DEU56DRAFT_144138 [Suillus clintonianus]|uniref:uncharacterized protein n=1 Tax=Suillus clintonianus TaxID=1904413 RepID=UPI001B873D18|nr:uncharacterized protein DEU56DRAFT_144138 [Suillus clintonianus]KAG2118365.1 hypothetical protein DEU56DRAFT_144138 [Suillus clintonianus]
MAWMLLLRVLLPCALAPGPTSKHESKNPRVKTGNTAICIPCFAPVWVFEGRSFIQLTSGLERQLLKSASHAWRRNDRGRRYQRTDDKLSWPGADYHSYRVVHVTMSVKKNSSQGHLAVVYGGFPQGMGQSLRETICSLSRKVIQTEIGGQVRPCAVTWFRTIYLCRLRRRQAPYGVVVGPLSIDEVSEDIYMLV